MRPAARLAVQVAATTVEATWRRRGWTTIAGLAGAGVGLWAAGQVTPTYVGTASVLIGPPPGAATTTGASVAVTPRQVADAAIVMVSPTVRADAAKLLGAHQVAPARARVQAGSDVVVVSVEASTAAEAARVSLAYADAYVADQQVTAVDALEREASTLAAKITDLAGQVAALDARIAAAGGPTTTASTTAPPITYPGYPGLTFQVSTVPTRTIATPPLSTANPTVNGLLAQRTALLDQEAVLQQQATSLQLQAQAFSGGGQVTSGGTPPGSPEAPVASHWAIAGGLTAFALAAAGFTVAAWRRSGPIVPVWAGRSAPTAGPAPADEPAAARVDEPAAAVRPAPPADAPGAGAEPQRPRTVVLRPRPGASGGTARLRFVPRRDGPAGGADGPGTDHLPPPLPQPRRERRRRDGLVRRRRTLRRHRTRRPGA